MWRGSVVRMKSSLEMFEQLAQLAELRRDAIGELARVQAGLLGGALDLLAVLVGAGQEEHILAEQARERAIASATMVV